MSHHYEKVKTKINQNQNSQDFGIKRIIETYIYPSTRKITNKKILPGRKHSHLKRYGRQRF